MKEAYRKLELSLAERSNGRPGKCSDHGHMQMLLTLIGSAPETKPL